MDLNHITIVPASGASHIPYLVYLARGRDVEKPAIIVLLDSDSGGNGAKQGLLRGGPHRKELLKPKYILQLGEISTNDTTLSATGQPLIETEDLVPMPICVRAVQRYLQEVCVAETETIQRVTAEAIVAQATPGTAVFKAIEECLRKIEPELHIEKIGFARAVIEVVGLAARSKEDVDAAAIREFEMKMRALFRRLRKMQREADRELTSERVSSRVNRAKESFLRDRATGAKREHAFVLFEEIETALDDSEEADQIRLGLQSLRREFKIDDDLNQPIDNFGHFRERLEGVRYAGRLATQDPTPQEAATVAQNPISPPAQPAVTATTQGEDQAKATSNSSSEAVDAASAPVSKP